MSEMLELALGYARSGIAVFPCREKEEEYEDEDGRRIVRGEKTPYASNGLLSATVIDRLINRRWEDNPAAMVGAATGSASGFWVLDIDVPSDAHKGDGDGRVWLDDMQDKHGRLPATKIGRTANGGYHFFFRHVDGIRNGAGIGPGVDVRGDGGFIIMPGSVMADGRFYEWCQNSDECDIADAPDWLIDAVINKSKEYEGAYAPTADYVPGKNGEYVESAVAGCVRNVINAGVGERGFVLNKEAFSLGTLVSSGDLSRAEAEAALFGAASTNGLVATDGAKEVMRKIGRGIDAAKNKPRAVPEQKKKRLSLRDLDRLVGRFQDEQDERGERERNDDGGGYHEDDDDDRYRETQLSDDYDAEPPEDDVEGDEDESDLRPIRATKFVWRGPETVPIRRFLWQKHLIRKYVSVTVAAGGIGKTSNSIAEALSMATGRDLLGVEVADPLNVWLFNAEDPMDELERRLYATAQYYGIKPHEFEGRIWLDSGRDQDLVIAREEKREPTIIRKVVESIALELKKNKIDVMIADPFVSTHKVNENDNGAIDLVAKMWSKIADAQNCAIEIVHHMKKVDGREATVDDARGASSLIGAARSVRVLQRMSEEQAREAGFDDIDKRHGYFAVTNGKNNLSPVSSKMEWRRLVGQEVGNGTKREPGDDAPVVTAFRFPSFMDQAEKLSRAQWDTLEGLFGREGGQILMTSKKKNAFTMQAAVESVLELAPGEDVQKVRATIAKMINDKYIKEDRRTNSISGEVEKVYTIIPVK